MSGKKTPRTLLVEPCSDFCVSSVEVTLGGWIVTYIINVRGGGPSSGYISSGFFGGLTLGRIGLLWVNRLVGDRSAVIIYGILVMGYDKELRFRVECWSISDTPLKAGSHHLESTLINR